MPKPEQYRCIRAWGEHMGSMKYYIVSEQEDAAEMNAPLDAIYKRDGVWHRAIDIKRTDLRESILAAASNPGVN